MDVTVFLRSEAFPTFYTREALLPRVYVLVSAQVALAEEAFAAFRTREGFQPRVDILVGVKVALGEEVFAALRTGEMPLPRVDLVVVAKVPLRGESFSTLCTGEWFLPRYDCLLNLPTVYRCKWFLPSKVLLLPLLAFLVLATEVRKEIPVCREPDPTLKADKAQCLILLFCPPAGQRVAV